MARRVLLINNAASIQAVTLDSDEAPPLIETLGATYQRIDDPASGEFTGAYALVDPPSQPPTLEDWAYKTPEGEPIGGPGLGV